MVCVPAARVEVVNRATPLFTETALEMAVEPSKNVTVPVALAGAMVAVKVAGDPDLMLSSGAVTLMLELALATVCTRMGLVDAADLLSPV